MKPSAEQFSRVFSRVQQYNGHWFSLYSTFRWINVVRMWINGVRKGFSHAVLLWWGRYGDPPQGQLTRACEVKWCVNPEHMRDGADREQFAWLISASPDINNAIRNAGYDPDDFNGYQIVSEGEAGTTKDFGCYSCGVRFDPLAGTSEVLCGKCDWRAPLSSELYSWLLEPVSPPTREEVDPPAREITCS